MRYCGNKAEDINIAYIGGGSRGWAWCLMGDLALEEQLSGTVRLYDIDLQAACDNETIGNMVSQKAEARGKWRYEAVKTLEEALAGANFVVISILPGTFKEMSSDVHTPEKYGIYQTVGDSIGPGGFFRALRTIPIYADFAANIKKYCPDAWVINYTNPMTLCTRTLYEVFPGIKAIGCCHEIFSAQDLLSAMLKDLKGIEVHGRDEIKVNVLGINHFAWLDKASYKGMDLVPLYREFVDKYYVEGYEGNEKGHWMNNYFGSAERVKFDLFRRYGLIAAGGDRHLAEFMPHLYLKNPDWVKSWKFSLTPVSWRIENKKLEMERSRKLRNGEEEFAIKPSSEEGVLQIKALLGLHDFVTNVNIPNQGQMKGIPTGAVVETNALIDRDSVRPLIAGELPPDLHSVVIRHVLNQEATLKAAMCKDRELAFRTFANDPTVASIDIADARSLFDEMLNNTKDYLPGWSE